MIASVEPFLELNTKLALDRLEYSCIYSLTDQTRKCPSDTAAAHTTQVD